MKKIIFVLMLIFLNISFVSAESGSIIISDDTNFPSYQTANAGGGGSANWSNIRYNSANYNYIGNFAMTWSGMSFVNSFESTHFTISQNGNGEGWVHYDRNTSKIYWVFTSDSIFSSSPITLIYDTNIFINVTGANSANSNSEATISKPVCIGAVNLACLGSVDFSDVNVAVRGTDYYSITYPISNYFELNITKNPYVDSKYFINGIASRYSEETTYNKINIVGAFFEYNDGIYLNATLASGVYTITPINSTLLSPVLSTISGNITTDKSSYNISENMLINYTFSNSVTYGKRILISGYTNTLSIYSNTVLLDSGDNLTFNIPVTTPIQEYNVALQYYNLSYGWLTLDYKDVNILPSNNISYTSFSSSNYNLGNVLHTITYSNITGYLILKNTNNDVMFNYSIVSGLQYYDYILVQNDVVGIWNLYLYNSTGTLLSNASTNINFDVVSDMTPSITISQSQIDSQTGLIDIGDALSQAVFGKIDSNDDYEYSDSEVSHVGNKIFSTLLLIAFILLISGAYYAVKNKRR